MTRSISVFSKGRAKEKERLRLFWLVNVSRCTKPKRQGRDGRELGRERWR